MRVVPARETEDGVLCVEMRIRIYPDGLMSNLLSQLIKVCVVDQILVAGRGVFIMGACVERGETGDSSDTRKSASVVKLFSVCERARKYCWRVAPCISTWFPSLTFFPSFPSLPVPYPYHP